MKEQNCWLGAFRLTLPEYFHLLLLLNDILRKIPIERAQEFLCEEFVQRLEFKRGTKKWQDAAVWRFNVAPEHSGYPLGLPLPRHLFAFLNVPEPLQAERTARIWFGMIGELFRLT
ncbi:MAG TPA: hypothetical protein VF020_18900 [Chthoniobacterales bacterium]